MRLEPEMWATLEQIASAEGMTLDHLCAEIDRTRGPTSLTAAVRSRIVSHLRGGKGVTSGPGGPVSELIRRHRASERSRSFLAAGDDYEDTITFDTSVIDPVADGYLAQCLRAWWDLFSLTSRAPSFEDLASRAAVLSLARPVHSLIDVTPENPANFQIDRLCYFTESRLRQSLDQTRVAAFPFRLHAQAMQTDFHAARAGGEPVYQISRQRFGHIHRDYKRLLLPLSCNGGSLTHLLSVVEPLSGRYAKLAASLRTALPA